MADNNGRIRIGTSGWHYKHWIGPFYPEKFPSRQFLSFYCDRFTTVEINNSFYRLPSEKMLQAWYDTTPDTFIFAMKASRYLTHMKKLKDPGDPLRAFLDRADILGDKLGPVLFQLPPGWRCNPERLKSFLDALPAGYRYVFEFRDQSWFREEVYEALKEKKAGFCLYQLEGVTTPNVLTADYVYVRLHGPGGAYQGGYDTRTLSGWAGAFATWRRQGRDIYCYFDNDQEGYAARNALELAGMFDK